MKSKDVKNWSYELSYSRITELEDFEDLLAYAISKDSCLLCGGDKAWSGGLCVGCGHQTNGKDREALEKVIKDYEVLITIKKRPKHPPTSDKYNYRK
jgi:hypothetical protein